MSSLYKILAIFVFLSVTLFVPLEIVEAQSFGALRSVMRSMRNLGGGRTNAGASKVIQRGMSPSVGGDHWPPPS